MVLEKYAVPDHDRLKAVLRYGFTGQTAHQVAVQVIVKSEYVIYAPTHIWITILTFHQSAAHEPLFVYVAEKVSGVGVVTKRSLEKVPVFVTDAVGITPVKD